MIVASQIAMGESQKQAAKIAKVSEQTVSEWAQRPEFKATVNRLSQRIIKDAQDEMRRLAVMNESSNDKVRMEAAKYVLETINIAPVEEAGLWIAGPITKEGVIKKELRLATL